MVDKYDKAQLTTIDNPGAGEYKLVPKPMPKKQMFTSNMMSATQRLSSGQRLHSVDYPSATTYNSNKYETIEHPAISGGAPNNILKLTHYDQKQKEKALNPFQTNEKSFKARIEIEEGHLGPGRYSPQNRADFCGSEFE
jgi:hypothetical protein